MALTILGIYTYNIYNTVQCHVCVYIQVLMYRTKEHSSSANSANMSILMIFKLFGRRVCVCAVVSQLRGVVMPKCIYNTLRFAWMCVPH